MRRQALMIAVAVMTVISVVSVMPVRAENEAGVEIAKHLIDLVKIGRAIVSEQMANISSTATRRRVSSAPAC